MADSEGEGESDFASAESEQEEENETVEGDSRREIAETKPPVSAADTLQQPHQELEKGGETGTEGESGETKTAEAVRDTLPPREEDAEEKPATACSTGDEGRTRVARERTEEERVLAKDSEEESKTQENMAEEGGGASVAAGIEGRQRVEKKVKEGDVVAKAESSLPAKTEEEGGGGGGGGGWGWGGWGRSLWSSVSTVTGSAQALSQKMTAAISTVEGALGLPSPQELAAGQEDQEQGEREKEGDEKERERGKESDGKVETLAKLAEKVVEQDIDPQASQGSPGPGSVPGCPEVDPESGGEQGESGAAAVGAFSGFFSGLATAVEQRGLQLMTGGLDALENIGKKTVAVLTEGDPGFQSKRRLLKREAPSLSALLREAKAEAEAKQSEAEAAGQERHTTLSYSALFDEYQGVIHLEALELLSKEYAAKVRGCLPSLSGEEGEWVEQQMEQVAEALTIRDDGEGLAVLDDDSGKLGEVVELFSDLTPPIKVEKLVKVSSFWREKLESLQVSPEDEKHPAGEGDDDTLVEKESCEEQEAAEDKKDDKEGVGEREKSSEVETQAKKVANRLSKEEVYANGLRGLVQLTSASIELFRKMAEVSLLPQVTKVDVLGQTKKFNRLTVLVSSELDALASVHAEVLTDLGLEDVNSTITALYMESSNSVSYVQDALQLLKPVLQYTVLQEVAFNQPTHFVHSRT